MLTDTFWEVIPLYIKVYGYLWEYPLYYDPALKMMYQVGSRRHLIIWYTVSITAMILCFLMSLLPLLFSQANVNLQFIENCMLLFTFILSLFGLTSAFGIFIWGFDMMIVANELNQQFQHLVEIG